ncbi:MAG: RsmE family RNA methyltransferase [Erysipelotrichaceae bacterium]|nr:RsmE family RNA methyltransferase [Erysipelotrichaceae bacterium]
MQQYFSDENIMIDKLVSLNDNQVHHIFNVMRKNVDDVVLFSDGNALYLCHLKRIDNTFFALPYAKYNKNTELPYEINLYMALIKNDKWDFVLQKATELGVNKIIPITTARTIVKINEKLNDKLTRWNKITLEACEQAHRIKRVKVEKPININEIKYDSDRLNLVAYENNDETHIKNIVVDRKVNIVIGPEGGFDQTEITFLTQIGYLACSLGNRILRAETAACYALSVLSLGDEIS